MVRGMTFARNRGAAFLLGLLLALTSSLAGAAGLVGPLAMRARHASLAPQFADNPFGGPMVLESQEAARRIDGDVYAVLDQPFTAVRAALADPAQWCDILILHLNTKHCRRGEEGGAPLIEVRVGKKNPQPVQAATRLAFGWRPATVQPDYLAVRMEAANGPYDTRDYLLLIEAVPLPGNRTFLHMGYALSYGGASHMAMHLYLGTVARDKVGFTPEGKGKFVGGMRGVVERNTMRYWLAIDAYLDSLSAPPGQQLEQRLRAWFDATERYPQQLHEVTRDDYLKMKRAEVQRQSAG